jgi:hexosaminidase
VFLGNGKASPLRSARFSKGTLRPADDVGADELTNGLLCRYYRARVSSVEEIAALQPTAEGATDSIGSGTGAPDEPFALSFSGFLEVPQAGIHTLYLTSDDGSRLTIGDRVVVDNDGVHPAKEESGQIALEAGYHPFRLLYYQAGRGSYLRVAVQWEGTTERRSIEPWLYRPR